MPGSHLEPGEVPVIVGMGVTVTATEELTNVKPSFTVTLYVVFTAGDTIGDAAEEVNPAGLEDQLYVYDPDPPEAFAASCTDEPAQTVFGVAVAEAASAPPLTETVTWSELTQPVAVEVAVRVKVVLADRFTVPVLRLVGLVT